MGKPVLPMFFLGLFLSLGAAPSPYVFGAEGLESAIREKVEVIDGLYSRGDPVGARGIVPYLKDRDLAVRSYAMKRLVDLGSPAVDTLIASLADEEVRWLVSGALINIGAESVRKTELALKHRNPAVRRNALFILRQLDARDASPSIREALSDPDASVQVQAIHTVVHFGGAGALPLVMEKADIRIFAVREAVIAVLLPFGEDAVPTLTTFLSHRDPDVRASGVRALAAMGTKEVLPYVRKMLSDPSPAVRYYACQSLGETGDPSVLTDLALFLDDRDPNVRDAASDAFARMPDAAKQHLIRFLEEGNPLQKITAATAIRKAKLGPCVPSLLNAIRDPSPEVKVAAVAALMVLADPGSVEGLVHGLMDPDIRWICIMALRHFGDKNIRLLLRMTGDPDLDYWKQHVLEGMGDRVLEGCLETLEKEQNIGTMIATLCTLRQIKDSRAIYPLIRLMADDKLGYVAGFVLSQMGDVAVKPLLFSLEDENPVVRARAAMALGEIGLSSVIKPLSERLSDEDLEVRLAAERAINKITGEEQRVSAPVEPLPR